MYSYPSHTHTHIHTRKTDLWVILALFLILKWPISSPFEKDLPEESSGESSPYDFGNDTIDSSPVLNENVNVGNYRIFEYDNNVSSPILDESSDVDESLALSEEELECNETYIRPQISDNYEDEEHESVVARLPLPKPWTGCFSIIN